MKKVTFLALISSLLLASACSSGNTNPTSEDKPQYDLTILYPFNGASKDIVDSLTKEYLSCDDENKQAKFLYTHNPVSPSLAKTDVYFNIDWYGGYAPYIVTIANDQSYTDEVISTTTYTHRFEVHSEILYPNRTYFYKITDAKGNVKEDSFKTNNAPKVYTVDGTSNVRDLGGWSVDDGKKIKFNKIYRGANVDFLSLEGKDVFLNNLNVVTDLDLRGANESEKEKMDAMTESPSGCKNFVNIRVNTYDDIITYPSIQDPLYKKIFETLAEPTNYPLYFHCSHGADRTGTVAYLLEGLLGMSYEDIMKDFELTSLYYNFKRWRSAINLEDGVYSFAESGIMQSDVRFGYMHKEFMRKFGGVENGASDETLKAAVENYLLNELGITQEQINSIRSLLIG